MTMTDIGECVRVVLKNYKVIYVMDSQMTPTRFRILKYVVGRNGSTEKQIRTALDIAKSTTNDALGFLMARGYITRRMLPITRAQRPEYEYLPWRNN